MSKELFSILDQIRGHFNSEKYLLGVAYYYLVLLQKEEPHSDIFKTEVLATIQSSLSENEIDTINQLLLDKFDLHETKTALIELMNNMEFSREAGVTGSNQSIINLASRFFEFNKGKFADFCSGLANMLSYALSNNVTEFKGIEINTLTCQLSILKLWLEHGVVTDSIVNKDIFKYFQENPDEKFQEIFSQFPLGIRRMEDYIFEGVRINKNSDWGFIGLVMNQLGNDGRAVVITSLRIEHAKPDEAIRQHFIENGYIEQIIALPAGLLSHTGIPVYMIVLSRNNDTIRFTDASEIYSTGGRIKYLTEENINSILSDSEISVDISRSQVLQSKRMSPEFYLLPEIKDGVELSQLAEIHRSKALRKQDMDKFSSVENMGIELIRLAHVKHGEILNGDYINQVIPGIVTLENLDIIVTRAGSALNVAIYSEDKDMVSTIDENFFVIRCNHEKINPYYLLAYLQSETGQSYLLSSYTGTVIQRINQKELSSLKIPLISKNKQDKIGSEMRGYIEKIDSLRLQLEIVEEEKMETINNWFEEGKHV